MPDGPIDDPYDNSAYFDILIEDEKLKAHLDYQSFIEGGQYRFTNDSPFEWQKEILDMAKSIVDNSCVYL